VIVDTSALVAVSWRQDGWEMLADALAAEPSMIPAPVIVEFALVTSDSANEPRPRAQELLTRILAGTGRVEPFSHEAASLAVDAHRLYGRGNGRGGKLNMLDIMVYCMAKRLDRSILCTGHDFASTDARIHPGSRGW
jgi:ribonuclease VapC